MEARHLLLALVLLLGNSLLSIGTRSSFAPLNVSSYADVEKAVSSVVKDEYVVTFRAYFPQEMHRQMLRDTIGSSGWEIVPRSNAASGLPSDFALIKVDPLRSESVLYALDVHEQIKHVSPQRRFQGVLSSHQAIPVIEQHSGLNVAVKMDGRKHAAFPEEDLDVTSAATSRKLHSGLMQVTHLLEADFFWNRGITGSGVKVAVFDTGLRMDHPHFRNIKERTDWTDENTLEDGLGHGTFVTGVIASQSECLGFAPDVDIHVYRVFTNERVSYTSWFLDAFNYAILTKMDVLNLSIGGPDFMDKPFVEKVWEMSANKIIVVSAIGNDGPLYGTLNNPADQADVMGVGGIDFQENLAPFSSRGMTTWELPAGYGRVKPDIVTFGQGVSGSRPYGGCRSLSGTSVASPVVAGAISLLVSSVPIEDRNRIVNPASIKQAIIESAIRIPKAHLFEQGFGKLNLLGAYQVLRDYQPRATFAPAALDFTQEPYMWPYFTQPIYATGMPLMANVTIYNGISVSSDVYGVPEWTPGENGELLEIEFTYSKQLWPWTGWLGLRVRVSEAAAIFSGTAQGLISLTIVSHTPSTGNVTSTIQLPLRVAIIPTPPSQQRVLFDAYHNLRYPSGYFPRDVLDSAEEPFDWNGDHPHTNFKDLYSHLKYSGYFIEVLGEPFTCFNASNYGVLLLVDPEEEYHPVEIAKLREDIQHGGLSLVVLADWYNVDVMQKIKFFDSNTERWWTPATGGANVPALNDLLASFGIAFGSGVYDGEFSFGNNIGWFASGTSISRFPKGGSLRFASLHDQAIKLLKGATNKATVPVLGLLSTKRVANGTLGSQGGRIAVFGDSSCLDNANQHSQHPRCLWLVDSLLQYASQGLLNENVLLGKHLDSPFESQQPLPSRMTGSELPLYSRVMSSSGACLVYEYQSFNQSLDTIQIDWEEPPVSNVNNLAQDRWRDRMRDQRTFQIHWNGYFLPYLLVIAGFVFLVVVAVKSRKAQRILHQRLLV